MNDERRLDILVSTRGRDGIERTSRMVLDRIPGVHYVVAWQVSADDSRELPAALQRDDIHVVATETVGLAVNRNIAFRNALAPYCLIADDDLEYSPERLKAVIATFDSHPEVDLASFMYEGPDNKWYPSEECDLTAKLPKGFSTTSFEVAFRRESVVSRISVNENFGVGTKRFACGEDSIFLLDCRRAGLNCRFFPFVITRHAGLTTGYRPIDTEGVAMGHGAYLRIEYGLMGLPRVPLFVWRNYRAGRIRPWWGLAKVLKGYFAKIR